MRAVEMFLMRALVWKLSVTMPICAPGEADGPVAEHFDGHRHQRDGNLLAGGQQHVHLARRRLVGDLVGQLDQLVGSVAAGADDHDHLVARLAGADRPPGSPLDPLRVRHAAAAELLHDQAHGPPPTSERLAR